MKVNSRKESMRNMAILLIFVSNFVFANSTSCPSNAPASNVDLSQYYGSVRDQSGVGWCYAYTSADLATGHLRKFHPGVIGPNDSDRISPADSAIAFNEHAIIFSNQRREMRRNTASPEILSEYMQVQNEIELLKKFMHRSCRVGIRCRNSREEQIELKKLETRKKNLQQQGGRVELLMEGGYNRRVISNINTRGICSEGNINFPLTIEVGEGLFSTYGHNATTRGIFSGSRQERCEFIRQVFPELAFSVNEWQEVLTSNDFQHSLYQLVTKACQRIFPPEKLKTGQIIMPGRYLKLISGNDTEPLLNTVRNKLDSLLDSGKAASIYFFPDYLTQMGQDPTRISTISTPHAALITGKRWNEATCSFDYIMRNSWGGCESYENPDYASIGRQCMELNTNSAGEALTIIDNYYNANAAARQELLEQPAYSDDPVISRADQQYLLESLQENYDALATALGDNDEVEETSGSFTMTYTRAHLDELSARIQAVENKRIGTAQELYELRRSRIPREAFAQTCETERRNRTQRFANGVSCEGDGKLIVSGSLIEKYTFGLNWIK